MGRQCSPPECSGMQFDTSWMKPEMRMRGHVVDWSSWSFLLSTCTYPALPPGLSECGQGMLWWWEDTSNGSKGRSRHAQNLEIHSSSHSSYYLIILESLPYLSSYAPTSLCRIRPSTSRVYGRFSRRSYDLACASGVEGRGCEW
jgi:hypothetical protein